MFGIIRFMATVCLTKFCQVFHHVKLQNLDKCKEFNSQEHLTFSLGRINICLSMFLTATEQLKNNNIGYYKLINL